MASDGAPIPQLPSGSALVSESICSIDDTSGA